MLMKDWEVERVRNYQAHWIRVSYKVSDDWTLLKKLSNMVEDIIDVPYYQKEIVSLYAEELTKFKGGEYHGTVQ